MRTGLQIASKAAMALASAILCIAFSICLFACSSGDASTEQSADSTQQQASQSQGNQTSSTSGETSGPSFNPTDPPAVKFDSKAATDLGDAKLDMSNLDKGYIGVSAKSSNRLKFEAAKDGVSMYFDLPSDGDAIIVPLSLGDGEYNFTVWENTVDQRYAKLAGINKTVVMEDEFQPFLVQNVFCDFAQNGAAAKLAAQLTADAQNEGDALAAIYDWVVENITYDKDKAEELSGKSGYVPDPDATVSEKTGICFDYSSLVAAMLRSLGIPCKIVTGNVAPNDIYHAWNMVLIDGTWITTEIDVKENTWTRIDTTFSASGADNSFVGDGTNYSERYTY